MAWPRTRRLWTPGDSPSGVTVDDRRLIAEAVARGRVTLCPEGSGIKPMWHPGVLPLDGAEVRDILRVERAG